MSQTKKRSNRISNTGKKLHGGVINFPTGSLGEPAITSIINASNSILGFVLSTESLFIIGCAAMIAGTLYITEGYDEIDIGGPTNGHDDPDFGSVMSARNRDNVNNRSFIGGPNNIRRWGGARKLIPRENVEKWLIKNKQNFNNPDNQLNLLVEDINKKKNSSLRVNSKSRKNSKTTK